MKTIFYPVVAAILFLSFTQSSYALFGQKEARAKAEQRAERAETELNDVKQKTDAALKTDEDRIQEMELWMTVLVIVALGAVVAVVYMHNRPTHTVVRTPAHEVVANSVIIDATNVIRASQDNRPSLLRLIGMLSELQKQKCSYICFFDANTGYVLEEGGAHDEAKAYRELVQTFGTVFVEVPGGKRADDYILDYAHRHGTPIISNDRYRDYAAKYPWITNATNRRVPFAVHSEMVQLSDLGMEASVPATLSPALDELFTVLKMAAP